MVLTMRYQVLVDGHDAQADVERRVENGGNSCVECILKYGFGDLNIKGNKIFIVVMVYIDDE